MSQENVEYAHRAYEAFNRRDLDALLALMDPEVRFTTCFVDRSDPYDSHDGVRAWWEDRQNGAQRMVRPGVLGGSSHARRLGGRETCRLPGPLGQRERYGF